jgi:hypothetical protein
MPHEMTQIVCSVVERCLAAGRPVGVHTPEGATIVTAAFDASVLAAALRRELAAARS